MIYQLAEFFRMIQTHHQLLPERRQSDLLGRLTSLHRTTACKLPDDSRRALGRFIEKRSA